MERAVNKIRKTKEDRQWIEHHIEIRLLQQDRIRRIEKIENQPRYLCHYRELYEKKPLPLRSLWWARPQRTSGGTVYSRNTTRKLRVLLPQKLTSSKTQQNSCQKQHQRRLSKDRQGSQPINVKHRHRYKIFRHDHLYYLHARKQNLLCKSWRLESCNFQ